MLTEHQPEHRIVQKVSITPICLGGFEMENDKRELHFLIKKYRISKGYTQQYVAEKLGVDKSTYAHYEAARRTPDIKKLRALANLYELNDELLGAELPIVVKTDYPKQLLDALEKVIKECKGHSEDFVTNKEEEDKLRNALKPVMDIRDNALDLPNFSINKLEPGTIVKRVDLDLRAEKLISDCLAKQNEVMGW